jgi:N-acetylmuramoyl-L-alanine amidase
MRQINKIIIHCAATRPSMDVGAVEIRRWHVQGNGWSDIGYHGVIRRNGVLESGRSLNEPGAHTSGHNKDSIGICLVGGVMEDGKTPEANFTPEQWATLERTVGDLLRKYPNATVHGHNEFAAKACPSFDVQKWWAGLCGN